MNHYHIIGRVVVFLFFTNWGRRKIMPLLPLHPVGEARAPFSPKFSIIPAFCMLIVFLFFTNCQPVPEKKTTTMLQEQRNVPKNCGQIVIVISPNDTAVVAKLHRFDRKENHWIRNAPAHPVSLGRTGLAQGRGKKKKGTGNRLPVFFILGKLSVMLPRHPWKASRCPMSLLMKIPNVSKTANPAIITKYWTIPEWKKIGRRQISCNEKMICTNGAFLYSTIARQKPKEAVVFFSIFGADTGNQRRAVRP